MPLHEYTNTYVDYDTKAKFVVTEYEFNVKTNKDDIINDYKHTFDLILENNWSQHYNEAVHINYHAIKQSIVDVSRKYEQFTEEYAWTSNYLNCNWRSTYFCHKSQLGQTKNRQGQDNNWQEQGWT